MKLSIIPLKRRHLRRLLSGTVLDVPKRELRKSYFSRGSISFCLIKGGEPVLAGGIVNLKWGRGEAWMIPTKFLWEHPGIVFRYIVKGLKQAALSGGFKRVQATCKVTISTVLFDHLGFEYEGTLKGFGPKGETCYMYSRIFN